MGIAADWTTLSAEKLGVSAARAVSVTQARGASLALRPHPPCLFGLIYLFAHAELGTVQASGGKHELWFSFSYHGRTHTIVRVDAGEFDGAIVTSFGVFFVFFVDSFRAVSISKAIIYQVHL